MEIIFQTLIAAILFITILTSPGCASSPPKKVNTRAVLDDYMLTQNAKIRQIKLALLLENAREIPAPKKIWYNIATTNYCAGGCNIDFLWELHEDRLFVVDKLHYLHFGRASYGKYYMSVLVKSRHPDANNLHLSIIAQEQLSDEQINRVSTKKSKFGIPEHSMTPP